MSDKRDKSDLYNQDLIFEKQSFSYKIYNYFYFMLRDKKELNFLGIYILYILETIQLMSYGLSEPHIDTWKENISTLETITDIIGISRITTLMKYIKFNIYLVIFFILMVLIFALSIFIAVQILFIKESTLLKKTINIVKILIYPLSIFLFIPITELVLLPLKCNSEDKVDIVKEGIDCWKNIHYLYSILGILSSVLFLLCIIFLNNLFFYPYNYHDSSIRIQSNNDNIFIFIKYIYVLRFILVKNEYLSISILFIFSLYALNQEFNEHSFNNKRLEIIVNLKYFLSFWTYFILLFSKFFKGTQINGLIYIYIFGIPFIIISCIVFLNKYENAVDYNISNFSSFEEYLKKTRILIKLIVSFINGSKNVRFGSEGNNQKEDILLKGIVKIHTLKCIREDCPLTKFIENPGNHNIQKQCLLNYMTIYFEQGMKRFPFSTELILYNIQFNFNNRVNLNAVRSNLSLVQNNRNTFKINFLVFMLSKDIHDMKNRDINGDMSNYEQEREILNQKYGRLKYLIENCVKVYGEFWGIFATNITNNLNISKLYKLGQKINMYLKEMDNLWNNELKTKRVDIENEYIIQLYSKFLKEILWNKKKSEEISSKLNDENKKHDLKKLEKKENIEGNDKETELESPNYIIYGNSNEKGECTISQCTSNIANLLGYMKSEIIGKKIEVLMPELFKAGHANMLVNKLKQYFHRNKTDNNSYRENEKKKTFIVAKSKMGYLYPFNAKIQIYEDTDFSNSFIIKNYFENKDSKSVYGYYILTKSDLTITNISSSAINLDLNIDIINKYAINIEFLIRGKNLEGIDFIEKLNEYTEELKEVIWIYPTLIYPKDKTYRELNIEDISELIKNSPKKKVYIQISVMKYGESNILGYIFKIIDSLSKKKDSNIQQQSFIPNGNKEILFDLLNLNYIRTEIVSEKTGNRNLREKEDNIENEKQINKSNKENNKKATNIEEIIESSEEDKIQKLELTKDKIMEFQTKDAKEIENFINQLTFYGEDVFMEKHRPNREKYAIGKGHDALIKISISQFIKKIENRMKHDMLKKYNNEGEQQNNDNKNMNEINHGFSSDISASFENLFKSKSLNYIKLISFVFFLVFLAIIVVEFVVNILNVQKIKDNILKMRNAYKLSEVDAMIKYIITEAVLVNKYKENYLMLTTYHLTYAQIIYFLKIQLESYSRQFFSIYEAFSNAPISSFSKKYRDFVFSGKTIMIYTLINGEETVQIFPFLTIMSRIPNSAYYISTIMDPTKEINLEEKNTYELMYNLLNSYLAVGEQITLILAEDAVESSKTNVLGTILFYLSFVFVIIFLIIIWIILSNFLIERQKPINLFLTIKKQIFEDLKNSSENFSNKLLNKQMGNEDNEEENQKEYQSNIKEKDINIIKFKAPNEYKTKGKNNKNQIIDFIVLLIFFIIIEAYITFKFLYVDNCIDNIKKFLMVFNLTYFSYLDILLNIDKTKSFIFNRSIPIYNYKNSENSIDAESPFFQQFYEITNSFENMIISTSNTTSFLRKSYKDEFSKYLNEDFLKVINMDALHIPNQNLLTLFNQGFKPVFFNIIEKLRFAWIQEYMDKENILNDRRFSDIDFLLKYILMPWYEKVIELLNKESDDYLNGTKIVQISLFIVVLVIFIFSYFIIWKSYEQSLSLILQKSFDLIKLIPEEIKYIIVTKLNE